MKKSISLLGAGFLSAAVYGQSRLVLQPNAASGKDACIYSSGGAMHDRNSGSAPENYAIAWTKSGADYAIRSLIQFDLTSIPQGAVIVSATLSLYCPKGSGEGNHFGFFGSNRAWLECIVTPWEENTVTWDHQPLTDSQGRVPIAGSTSVIQHYPKINVSGLVQEMVNDPGHRYGFMLKLQQETPFKKLVFASSDHPDAALHPRLVVVYHAPVTPVEQEQARQALPDNQVLKIFPNPAKTSVHIAINTAGDDMAYISVYDLGGREMSDQAYQLQAGKNQFLIETATWPRGLYMVIVKTGGDMITEKLMLE